MNKYFTKEYIKECDCKEIQGLKEYLDVNDFYYDSIACTWEIYCPHEEGLIKTQGGVRIWLPTGDQLDEEIVKICEKKRWRYKITHYPNIVFCEVVSGDDYETSHYSADSYITNDPLIAKIKLLKELLK